MRINEKTKAFLQFSLDLLRYKRLITLANVLCNVPIFAHQAAVTFCVRQILNGLEAAPGQALHYAMPYLIGILLVALIRVGAIMGCAVLDTKRSFYYQSRTRMNAMKLLLRKNDITQVAGNSTHFFEVLDDDIPISTFPAELLTEVTGYFIYTLIALTMLLSISWALTLFIFIPLSVAIYGTQRLSERIKEGKKANREAHDAASAFIADIADTAIATKTLGTEQALLKRYGEVNASRRNAVLRDAILNERIASMLQGAVVIGSAVMMVIAARLISGGSFGIGDFSIFIAHLFTLADCVGRIVELVHESRKAEVSYERVLSATDPDHPEGLCDEAGLTLKKTRQVEKLEPFAVDAPLVSYEVNGLSFQYSGGEGFREVSFSVGPGELVVIAGEMASGKSTLLSVLMGLMPGQSGEILFSGSAETEAHTAGAPQSGGYFAADIMTNLCLGAQISEVNIKEALFIAALDDMDTATHIGGRGGRLSGGQRQRLALARTFARGAAISFIDDCVSALDEETRTKVLGRLTAHLKHSRHAAIIATNMEPFMSAADKVIFMECGCVKYVATHGKPE